MKAIKITMVIVVSVTLLVTIVVVAAVLNVGSLVTQTVESKGSRLTETQVRLAGVNVHLLRGTTELTGFSVANPQGFSAPYAFKSDVLRVKVNPLQFNNSLIVIDDLTLEGVNIVVEQKGLTTNIQQLQRAIKRFSSSSTANNTNTGAVPAVPGAPKAPQRFIIKNLHFANNTLEFVSEYGSYRIDMPPLTRVNLDGGGAGLTSTELGIAVMEPIITQTEAEALSVLGNALKNKWSAELEKHLGDDKKSILNQVIRFFGKTEQ